jgi:Flp pilus assembly protein TadD
MGIALQKQNKLEEAIEAYNKALAIKPNYADAYNNMGIASQRAKQAGRGDRGLQQSL